METAEQDFSWMDAPPAVKKAKRRVKKAKRQKKVVVASANKVDHETRRGRAMHAAVAGRKRVWACDGQYVFFRRKSCLGPDGQTDGSGNIHAAVKRHDNFIKAGDLTYIETQDDVEVCKVNPQSALYRKGVYLGEMNNGMVQRAIVIAACKRDWVTYADALTEFAGRIKGKWDSKTGEAAWLEVLNYIDVLIAQRGGPTPAECGAQLQNVRIKRGEGQGKLILLGK